MFSKADAYERFMGRWSRLLAPPLVAFAEIREGDHVLDLGSGTGALSFALLDATRNGRVTGVDPSQDYVNHAARQRDDPRIHFQVGDAQQLTFPSATFDKVVSALVLNFVPDPAHALAEMIRVTKSHGLVTAAVWDYGDGMEMLRAFWDEATALDAALAARDEALMPLCKRGELAALWTRGGLEDVQETELTIALRFTSFHDYWTPFSLGQGPAGACVASMSQAHRSALEQRLRTRLLAEGPDRPINMRARAWAVRGRIPR